MSQQWPLEKPHRLLFKKKKSPVYLKIRTLFLFPTRSHTFAPCPTCRVLMSVVLNPRSPGPLSELTGVVVSPNQP